VTSPEHRHHHHHPNNNNNNSYYYRKTTKAATIKTTPSLTTIIGHDNFILKIVTQEKTKKSCSVEVE